MADTIVNKPSIQIRSGLPSPLPDKSPSPATKLLISHGKPNFTISRSPTVKDNGNPLSPQPNANNNYNAYKSANTVSSNNYSYNNNNNSSNNSNNNNNVNNSKKFVVGTKFNGVFKPSNAAATWAASNGNGIGNGNGNGVGNGVEENEAAKVVLRRPKLAEVETAPVGAEEENVPEFIRRQRRIQERLAKENVLDFENRRSGYFTHVMISPDSPNRTSFVETMASPAIVPALEMPLPARIEEEQQQQQQQQHQTTNGHSESELNSNEQQQQEQQQQSVEAVEAVLEQEKPLQPLSNGHAHDDDVAAEEVAQAIEEVIKAVAGEDDDSKPETDSTAELDNKPHTETLVPAAVEAQVEVLTPVAVESTVVQNGDANGHDEAITISHTNGHTSSEVPSIATTSDASDGSDVSGAQGVNFEPKTVVSFSQELGAGENNHPDTVKVVKDATTSAADAELQELSKLKFDIKNDGQNEVQVTPVLRATE